MPHGRPASALLLPLLAVVACAWPGIAAADTANGGTGYGTASQAPATPTAPGGTSPDQTLPTPPAPAEPVAPRAIAPPAAGQVAKVRSNGLAVAPAGAPPIVRLMIQAGNRIARTPYVWGGGHARWNDRGYDCSGSVSFVLNAAGLLAAPLVSGDLARWGDRGPGSWVTIWANGGHTYMSIAGLRFDTSGQKLAGTRWQAAARSSRGFKVRHPPGL